MCSGNWPATSLSKRVPAGFSLDFSTHKNFRLPKEGHDLQFRWEAFNTFNTPLFNISDETQGIAGTELGGAGFGIASAGTSHREMQFGLKLYF